MLFTFSAVASNEYHHSIRPAFFILQQRILKCQELFCVMSQCTPRTFKRGAYTVTQKSQECTRVPPLGGAEGGQMEQTDEKSEPKKGGKMTEYFSRSPAGAGGREYKKGRRRRGRHASAARYARKPRQAVAKRKRSRWRAQSAPALCRSRPPVEPPPNLVFFPPKGGTKEGGYWCVLVFVPVIFL